MKKNKKEISNSIVYLVLVIIIFIFGVSAQVLTNKELDGEITAGIEYTEKSSLNYRVYYSENPFYTDEYITEGKTYVQEYVDKISADFSYDVEYTDKLTKGEYEYYVQAKLIAYTPGDEDNDLWTKEYRLTDVETASILKDSSYAIKKSVDIDYHMFKNDFETYRITTGVNANAKLIVELIVNNHGEYPDLDNFDYSSSVKMEFPLGDTTFKIKTTTTDEEDKHRIVKFREEDHEKLYMKVIVILLWILAIFTTVVLIIVVSFNRKKISYYERILRKILITHDSIIVNVEKLPSLSGKSIVDVTSFDELLDAQGEVRLPINFKEDKKKHISKFVLVHDDLAWVYTLDEKRLEDAN